MNSLLPLLAAVSLSVSAAFGQSDPLIPLSPALPWGSPAQTANLLNMRFPWTAVLNPAPAMILPSLEVRPPLLRLLLPSEVVSVIGGEKYELRQNPGLNLFPLPALNLRLADELYLEHQSQARVENLNGIARAIDRGGDPAEAASLRKALRGSNYSTGPGAFAAPGEGGFTAGLIGFRN